MSLERFSRRIRLTADNVTSEVNKIVRQVGLAVDQALVLATPVDTGRARSNWIVSLNRPVNTPINPYAPIAQGTDPSKSSERANAQAALQQGQNVIARRQSEQTIYITNNVDYINNLNEGSSAQAPAMFVQQAVQAGVDAIVGARLEIGPEIF